MSLVFDRRDELGDHPGTHALVVGVSAYPHLPGGAGAPAPSSFGLGQFPKAASTAYRIHQWLLDRRDHLAAPLATSRLLLSPSEDDVAARSGLGDLAEPATVDRFLKVAADWRSDAATHRDGLTFAYFVGNGIAVSRSVQTLLLEDFGDGVGPAMRGAVNVATIFNGLAPSDRQPEIARRQIYFLDALRGGPSDVRDAELLNPTPVFDTELAGIDDREAIFLFGGASKGAAKAASGDLTLFGRATLECLDGGSAELGGDDDEEYWAVNSLSLAEGVARRVSELGAQHGVELNARADGLFRAFLIHRLDEPPTVELQIEVEPAEALSSATLELRDDADALVWRTENPASPVDLLVHVPAGIYSLTATTSDDRYVGVVGRARPVLPPTARRVVNLSR